MGATMKTRASEGPPRALALLFLLPAAVRAVCPPACACWAGDRHVDCSARNLTELPGGLQENITRLNLSGNRLEDLDGRLTPFANLRTLDLSRNRLAGLPARLPRSLWQIHAAHNRIRVLQKLDTAYQWNLRVLDVSGNAVERAVLINNTLASLRFLNLSGNRLWTVPTNIPRNTETMDLSYNFLTQILPGSLGGLSRLAELYLHDNRFAAIPDGAFDRLAQLRLITLYGNPWACEEEEAEEGGTRALSYLQAWVEGTKAVVLGRPCSEEADKGSASPPTAAEGRLFVKAMKAAGTAEPPPGTAGPSRHAPQELGAEDETAGPAVAFAGTDRPLLLGPSTGGLRPYEAGPAAEAAYAAEAASGDLDARARPGSPTTPLTLSIASGVPTDYARRPPGTTTTTTAKKEEPATKTSRRAPSSRANLRTGDPCFVAMLAAAALATGTVWR